MTRYLIPTTLLAAVLLAGFDASPETKRGDKFAVGTVLNDPKTLKLDYPTLIEVTAEEEEWKTYQKYGVVVSHKEF
jgi:hypothetical protein